MMGSYNAEICIGIVDIYSPEIVGACCHGDASEFENWSDDDKKAVLTIAHRDQGNTDKIHSDCGFAVSTQFIMLLGQCTLSGHNFAPFYDYLLAALPTGYIDMIVENYFTQYSEERGL